MSMDPLEQELRNALRRQEPPVGFHGRVRMRIEQKLDKPGGRGWFGLPRLRWALAVALCIVALIGVGYRYEQQRQRAVGKAMAQQASTALQIAGSKIRLAQESVQRLSE